MSLLIKNIKELLQVRESHISVVKGKDMRVLPSIKNAYLLIEHDTIVDYGSMDDIQNLEADKIIDASGKIVLPTWCDSHTHIVYAGNREQEFVDRINGLSYEDIANRGGGILNSAEKLQNTTEEDLYQQSAKRLKNVIKLGTGAIEIKSGYGLTLEAELKMLRVIKRLKKEFPVKVRATLLAAHAVPKAYKNNKTAFVDLVVNKMIPEVANEKLANYIDVFCEKGYFDLEDTERILKTGREHGLIPKIHVNQFNAFGGVEMGVKYQALSVDHLEQMDQEDIEVLKNSDTMPVALPSCSYFLSIPYTPGRQLIDAGLPLALATDYNPGSTPSGNMNFVVSTACIKMKMTPEEAINAATINGAYAMGISNMYGSITKGKKANLIITKEIPSYAFMPYAFGENHIEQVIINGLIY
ncbi:MAG: imidazolonepropionase [Xanthomarina sp.]|uniref:Imidazolonepropionase n=1 Tax=Xanthomarina gelatinilytica TaxID=1137281 RepID=A0A3D6BSL3_9FLAO|nr:imidazolonepropionase [Xanthomarina sp.]MCB0387755.1 imidazolonepropionase [Winogradskyella sp.]HAB27224.1 imidazolonepropionase [Xanthomarina gelatinilytica]MAL23529.1 imidazolonepropionase [Xanthomarina sp.]MBF61883.1 imidazolonepropionase [Xanthomarina sp.]HCY81637.1 imidazolonepropionase [Xanthomarina gelatinilytica]